MWANINKTHHSSAAVTITHFANLVNAKAAHSNINTDALNEMYADALHVSEHLDNPKEYWRVAARARMLETKYSHEFANHSNNTNTSTNNLSHNNKSSQANLKLKMSIIALEEWIAIHENDAPYITATIIIPFSNVLKATANQSTSNAVLNKLNTAANYLLSHLNNPKQDTPTVIDLLNKAYSFQCPNHFNPKKTTTSTNNSYDKNQSLQKSAKSPIFLLVDWATMHIDDKPEAAIKIGQFCYMLSIASQNSVSAKVLKEMYADAKRILAPLNSPNARYSEILSMVDILINKYRPSDEFCSMAISTINSNDQNQPLQNSAKRSMIEKPLKDDKSTNNLSSTQLTQNLRDLRNLANISFFTPRNTIINSSQDSDKKRNKTP